MTLAELVASFLYAASAVRSETHRPWPDGSDRREFSISWRMARSALNYFAHGGRIKPL